MTTIKANESEINDNILISVNTVNLTKKQCEEIIRKDVSEYVHKYFVRKEINIIQFSVIVNQATKKLAEHYEFDKKVIKYTTKKYITRAKAKQASYTKKH